MIEEMFIWPELEFPSAILQKYLFIWKRWQKEREREKNK